MWEAWVLSRDLKVRPSELFHISDQLQAYWFDRAVRTFGVALQNDLDRAGMEAKSTRKAEVARLRVMHTWMGTEMQYKNPVASNPKKPSKQKDQNVTSDNSSGAVAL